MHKPLAGMSAAILVANGFNEIEMTTFQRAILEAGGTPHIVSVENSLVNGWRGSNWGLNHPVDKPLSNALAADYDILVIAGGERSHEKLKTTAHSKRFIGGFMAAYKPVMAVSDAVKLMADLELLQGITVSGPENVKEAATFGGAVWSEDSPVMHHNLFSGNFTEENKMELTEGFITFAHAQYHGDDEDQQAAA
ncbi:MAG TPA: DJ-1/PfpI family protein [Alphaproteobacteria bacterium]|nr:DJ-1/PfpI family protein [Alphaproteobacteria bacterium]MCB9984448.1 DJ-1/PfpI family protein [Micavibrio sp.]HRK97787.1 DJ-1/PfpI family protein [Alphaproteobacteria bacterium]